MKNENTIIMCQREFPKNVFLAFFYWGLLLLTSCHQDAKVAPPVPISNVTDTMVTIDKKQSELDFLTMPYDSIPKVVKPRCEYDTVLYGNFSSMIRFKRKNIKDSLAIIDTLVYPADHSRKEISREFLSSDLKMNLLYGPVKSVYIYSRPFGSYRMLPDSTWQLIFEPFNKRDPKYKYIDHIQFSENGRFSKGNITYNNWNITPNKENVITRDGNGRIKDLEIDAKEFGTFGGRYFYNKDGFLKNYNAKGYEDGYKVSLRMENGNLISSEMQGIAEGVPYRYKRNFTIVDTDTTGNWTIRICKESYYPGKLYFREGQEDEPVNVSMEDIESWQMVIDWQNSWEKKEDVSQFAVFEENPTKIRRWVEVRKIVYY